MIGDSVTDIVAVKNLNVSSVGVIWDKHSNANELVLAGADIILPEMKDITRLF